MCEKQGDAEDLDDANLLKLRPLPGKKATPASTSARTWPVSRDEIYPRIDPGVCGHIHRETRHNTAGTTSYQDRNKGSYQDEVLPEIIKEVEVMLEADIIEQSKSAHCSSFMIVKKKDGTNRFCIDFRKQNLMLPFQEDALWTGQLSGKVQLSDEEYVAPGQCSHSCIHSCTHNCMDRTCGNPAQQDQEGESDHMPVQVLPRLCILGVCQPHGMEWLNSHGWRQAGQDTRCTRT